MAEIVKSQVRLPRELAERLRAEAARRGLSQNAVFVLALESYFAGTPPPTGPERQREAPAPNDMLDFD